jgi:phosphoesterase RecJ-like protein
MYKEIFKYIKKYNNIVIARHIGVDPDAMASQIALRDSIKLTFPEKKVLAVGNGSAKFSFLGKLDKYEDMDNALLILVDLPDKKRVDGVDFSKFDFIIKIDHHPFVEDFGGLEYIDDTATSACEILMDLILNTKLECNKEIAELLYCGLISDSNRFLFSNTSPKTFSLVSTYLDKYKFDITELYKKMYARPLNEVRLEGYIAENMIITDNGVGYIDITDDVLNKFKVDSAAPGNMINNFNFINEVLVWVTITEDTKAGLIRVSIRSRGPVINTVAEKYNGGGHKMASGARVETYEQAHLLINDLDKVALEYIKENKLEESYDD